MLLQIAAALTDNFSGIIYDHNIFIIQATGLRLKSSNMGLTSAEGQKLDRFKWYILWLLWKSSKIIIY